MSGILTDGITVAFVIIVVLTANVVVDKMNEVEGVCINGECGFELGCVNEVTIEIANENGVQVLQQQCVKEGWTRDTPYAKELREAGFKSAEVRFD